MIFRLAAAGLWLVSVALLLLIGVSFFFPRLIGISGPLKPVVELFLNVIDIGDSVTKITVIGILLLFGWALAEVLLRVAYVVLEHRAVGWFAALATEKTVGSSAGVRLVHTDLSGAKSKSSAQLLQTRAASRANLINNSDAPNLEEALPGGAALDAANLSGRYTALHVYAWILPVLGFIGTASGMAHSIAGFSAAISNTADTQGIIAVLSERVIPGLTHAFETTMLALAASVVVYVCTTAVQSWDREELDKLDRLSLAFVPPAVVGVVAPDLTEIVLLMRQISAQMSKFDEAAGRILHSANTLNDAAANLLAASEEVKQLVSFPYVVTIAKGERK